MLDTERETILKNLSTLILQKRIIPKLNSNYLTELGFEIIGSFDEYFNEIKYPTNWTIFRDPKYADEISGEGYYDVFDEINQKRIRIFLDWLLDAPGHQIHYCKRFTYNINNNAATPAELEYGNKVWFAVIIDHAYGIKRTYKISPQTATFSNARKELQEWLEENKPAWRDIDAYWNDGLDLQLEMITP